MPALLIVLTTSSILCVAATLIVYASDVESCNDVLIENEKLSSTTSVFSNASVDIIPIVANSSSASL